MLIKRVFLSRHLHPCKNDGTATGYDIREPFIFLEAAGRRPVDAAVDRHEVHAVLGMHPHNIKPFLRRDLL